MEIESVRKIATIFGKVSADDKTISDSTPLHYKGKAYKVIRTGISIPKNKKELNKFQHDFKELVESAEAIAELLLEEQTKHTSNLFLQSDFKSEFPHEVEGPPYHNCYTYLYNLLISTKEKLHNWILDLESTSRSVGRLQKPDFIAFYRPFHFYPLSWGIYLDMQQLAMQAGRIMSYNTRFNLIPSLSIAECVLLSFFKTYYHELYHHKFEMFATKQELILRNNLYTDGFHPFYCETYDTDYCLEEAFANVYGLNKSLEFLTKKEFISHPIQLLKQLLRESVLKVAPPGYRVSYEITSLELVDQHKFENKFIEILYDYCYQKLFNTTPLPLENEHWKLFTYKLDPLVNTENEVTFIIPEGG